MDNHRAGRVSEALREELGEMISYELSDPRIGEAVGPVAEAIRETFGSFNTFQAAFTDAALQVFGSGWAFLVLDPQHGSKLKIHTTANQDSVLLEGLPGLLCCDVWEHAYYLKYQNRRADYLAAFWNVVDWEIVGHRLAGMQAGKKQL